uniref:shark V-NAR antibody n=1 Tax=Squalus acanthias TaxID=7797 RepID=UPI00032D673D|nr:Chain C, shark V-NAR antibody [Squalus acanthias]4HGK_D Chain D, shark V-NAR antibody [Squalus acanthias]
MGWSCIILFLVATATGAHSTRVDQTPRTATRETGESLTINCVLTDTSYPLYSTYWYRKNPGSSNKEQISISGRYVESVNKGTKSFSLRIKDLTVADSATYICRAMGTNIWTGDGAGTVLTVNHHHHHH